MKKIAYCLYGQPRNYINGFIVINNLIEKYKNEYEFDFFFHTWFDSTMISNYYDVSSYRHISSDSILINADILDNLLNLYNPKSYKNEKSIVFDTAHIVNSLMYLHTGSVQKQNIQNTLSNIYSKHAVGSIFEQYIKDTNTEYEFVITSRFDLTKNINIDLLNINKTKIYSMNVLPRMYIVDHLLICSCDLFLKYSNTFLNLENIINNNNIKIISEQIRCGYNLVAESLVTCNMILYYDIDIINMIDFNNNIPNFI
jgi:hypothetical protein